MLSHKSIAMESSYLCISMYYYKKYVVYLAPKYVNIFYKYIKSYYIEIKILTVKCM